MDIVKFILQVGVQDEEAGHPQPLLRTVSFPFSQVLETPTAAMDIQKTVNSEFRLLFNDPEDEGCLERGTKSLTEKWDESNLNLTTDELMMLSVSKGPMYLRDSFLD